MSVLGTKVGWYFFLRWLAIRISVQVIHLRGWRNSKWVTQSCVGLRYSYYCIASSRKKTLLLTKHMVRLVSWLRVMYDCPTNSARSWHHSSAYSDARSMQNASSPHQQQHLQQTAMHYCGLCSLSSTNFILQIRSVVQGTSQRVDESLFWPVRD